MILKSSIFAGFLAVTMFFGNLFGAFGDKEKEQAILRTLIGVLQQHHFSPIQLDDDFSVKAFDYYLDRLDGTKRFLIQDDIDQLEVYKLNIDDQARELSLEFFDLSAELIDKAYDRAEGIYKGLIAGDFDLHVKENIELDSDKNEFMDGDEALRDKWRKMLKYEINSRLYNKISSQMEEDSPVQMDYESYLKELEKNPDKKQYQDFVDEAKEDVKELFDDWFVRLGKERRSDRFETYLNTIANLHDPHSGYFNPKEKQDFDINMGGKLEGIGARLTTEGDYTKVASIVVGGPAWKGKELEVDDLITTVTQKGKEPLDVTGMRVDDVVQHIRGKKGTVVILTVKKKDGSTTDVEIERDEVIIDESFAKSAIIDLDREGAVVQDIGYIHLPKFYSSFEREGGNSCAVDVAAEIEKVKKHGVNGIILDLRYNTGGSLPDVIQMSGLFIEEGPIVQVKQRNNKAYAYDDEDAEVRYDGPLIVLVNSISASASEILAAALQDYGRAVIVGSTSTFGKGTVQRFIDLDRAVVGMRDVKPLGNLKLTIQKYYRVNGGSVQLKGVTPDILLPDRFTYVDSGEKQYENAMEWSEIDAVEYGQNVYKIPNLNSLATKSGARIESNDTFKKILDNAKRIKENREDTNIPLDYDEYEVWMNQRKQEADKFDGLFEDEIVGLEIQNHPIDIEAMEIDSAKIERNENWLNVLKKDVYLEEALFIMKDMLSDKIIAKAGTKENSNDN